MNRSTLLIALSIPLILTACGGGGSSSSTTNTTSATTSTSGTSSSSGTSGTSSSSGSGSSPTPASYAYTLGTGGILQYAIQSNGALSTSSMPPVSAGTSTSAFAIDPTGKYAYAVDNSAVGAVHQYTIGSNGVLSPMSTPTVAAGTWSWKQVISPNGKYVYVGAGDTSGNVLEYAIGSTGALTLIGTLALSATNDSPDALAIDPSGQYLYTAATTSSTNTNLSQYSIGTNGVLATTPVKTIAIPSRYTSNLIIDPKGKFAYLSAADNGAATTSLEYEYSIDSNGILNQVGTFSAMSEGSGIAIDTTGQYAYLTDNVANTVAAYKIETSGTLTLISKTTQNSPDSITVDPTNKYVYVMGSNGVTQYAIGSSGGLTLVSTSPVSASRFLVLH